MSIGFPELAADIHKWFLSRASIHSVDPSCSLIRIRWMVGLPHLPSLQAPQGSSVRLRPRPSLMVIVSSTDVKSSPPQTTRPHGHSLTVKGLPRRLSAMPSVWYWQETTAISWCLLSICTWRNMVTAIQLVYSWSTTNPRTHQWHAKYNFTALAWIICIIDLTLIIA